MKKSPSQIALGLFLMNSENKKNFESFLKQINAYLASLNPQLTKEEKTKILMEGIEI